MRVYRCDRCGRFFGRKELKVMVPPMFPVLFSLRIKRHVCGDCGRDFYHWWRNPDGSEAPKSSETTAKLLRNEVRNGKRSR